jgi:threonyl-tRNA synthetase
MKKILVAICLFVIALPSFSQTCEEREGKLLSAVGSFSAAALYNTYGTIGAIGDAFGNDAYTAETVTDLINAQKSLIDNLVKVLDDLKSAKALASQSDIDYATSAGNIFKGLKSQAQLILNYTKNKTQANLDLYETQRKKNWKEISKLMGIEE